MASRSRSEIRMLRYDDESFDFALTHAEYAIEIRRRADVTAMALPIHKTVFIGRWRCRCNEQSETFGNCRTSGFKKFQSGNRVVGPEFAGGGRHRSNFARTFGRCEFYS